MSAKLIEMAQTLRNNGMRCNCDLDNWVPEESTGHSWVCRIHKAVMENARNINDKSKESQSNEQDTEQ
jgi:hypothetical protein